MVQSLVSVGSIIRLVDHQPGVTLKCPAFEQHKRNSNETVCRCKRGHADPGRSRPGFSKIYTPHNLLPQQNVREEAIVYCQSINNLDCWHKTDWSVKCLTIPHLKFCTRICSFVRGRETSLCFTYNHIMCFRLKDDKWIIPSVEVDCLNGECLKWQINYFLQILSDALGHIKT